MTRGMALVAEAAPELPDDLGQALLRCAQAFTRSSGSSYGTLLATGLMAMAKATKGRTAIEVAELSALVAAARDAMIARGKAELGGKTVLDSLDAVAKALDGVDDPAAAAEAARGAAREALDTFRDRPATVGRARIFAEKSRGLDDPGMLAMALIVEADRRPWRRLTRHRARARAPHARVVGQASYLKERETRVRNAATFPSSTFMSSLVTSATRRSRSEPAAVSTAIRPASSHDFSLTPTTSTIL